MTLQATLAVASSSGVRASCGSMAACAGLCAVLTAVSTAASTSTAASGAPTATTSPIQATSTPLTSAQSISTARRECRSTSIAVYVAATADGTMRTTAAAPTAPTPPSWYAYSASRIENAHMPSDADAHAASRRAM